MCEGIRVSICISPQKFKPVDHELAKPVCALFVQMSVSALALYQGIWGSTGLYNNIAALEVASVFPHLAPKTLVTRYVQTLM